MVCEIEVLVWYTCVWACIYATFVYAWWLAVRRVWGFRVFLVLPSFDLRFQCAF